MKNPIFTIDTKPYGTDMKDKYSRLFFDELTGTTQKERG
jgi:hypothetical protein